jgi:DNA-binding transcriptional LysR family regulator
MLVDAYLANGGLIRVLEDWRPPFSGYHLYYPSGASPRRNSLCWSTPCVIVQTDAPRVTAE